MTLFNFVSTDNYKEISKTSIFKMHFKKMIVIFLITFSLGLLIGFYFNEHTMNAVKYVAEDSISTQMIHAAAPSQFTTLLAIFFNNSLIAGLLLVFPIHLYNIQRKATKDWTESSKYEHLNPIWISYIMVGFQMLMIGNFIGYAIPIINNNVLVLASLLPHGIIEIPIMLMSSALGMSFATREISKSFIYNDCLNFFIKFIIPAVLLAAFIEAYITPVITSLV